MEVVPDFSFLGSDMHSHFIPGIDDGAQSREDSLVLIRGMQRLGFRKLVTTPHVYGEFYDNSREGILEHFGALKSLVAAEGIEMELEVGAEYFLDSYFKNTVLPGGLLSFGGDRRYVLVEVSMAGWPRNFDELIFDVQAQGYNPVLAHPERYVYEMDPQFFMRLKERGVLMQMNILALAGYYGGGIQQNADHFLEAGVYDFCGSDMHHERHLVAMERLVRDRQDLMVRLKGYGGFGNLGI